jgi:hypothetical protein
MVFAKSVKMNNSKELIEEHGVKGALRFLKSKLPSTYIPKILRDKKEYKEINNLIKEVEISCTHQSTRNECIDYHRRDFGTTCNDCGKILNTNG